MKKALMDLFSVCLDVTADGRYHAHMTYSAHVEGVNVYVLPSDTDYQSKYEYSLYESAYAEDAIKKLTDLVADFLFPVREEVA